MPNWVENEVTISGPAHILKEIKELLARPYVIYWPSDLPAERELGIVRRVESQQCFSFWNVVSPEDLNDYVQGQNWYDWNNKKWGTKWDASDPECGEVEPSPVGRLDGFPNLTYSFQTAWSPPCPVLAELSRLFPAVQIYNRWTEEQGFGEVVIHQNGCSNVIDSWDIPEWEQEEEENET